ncbi:MAG: hypothetical protein KatS3mg095_0619 [Candidatus Parcubacteria bacterium]|nr:MAG: hypothetical protein KatS3mg095_0619 [Candidatus Parcubacteria bacterium]
MKKKITFSCLIPAYNEEGRVGAVVKVAKSHPLVKEVIVISDGSVDKTAFEAKINGADKVIELKKNLGKGGAIFIGAKESKSNYLILLDADLVNLKTEHIDNLINPIIDNKAEMTIGVLANDPNQKIFPILSGQRALPRKIILDNPQIKKSRFQLELLLTQLAKENGYRIIFIDLIGLSHIKKRSKYRFWIAIYKYIESFYSFFVFYLKRLWLYLGLTLLIFLIFYPQRKTFSDLDIITSPNMNDRILVIVAHPDDETIGLGGYLSQAVKNGSQVKVVIVTNGEGNKYYAYFGENKFFSKEKFIYEEQIRMKEALAALKTFNIQSEDIIFLGFPDRGLINLLSKNWFEKYVSPFTHQDKPLFENKYNLNSYYSGEELVRILRNIIFEFKPTKLFTHSLFDQHPDHQAVNHFTNIALSQTHLNKENIYTFLVHYHNFSNPWELSKNKSLLPPSNLQSRHWLVFPLTDELIILKEKAINEYKSQLKSPYLNLLLKSFIRKNELFYQGLN